ncbi:hypothetical protein [Streptomyces sp. NBC_00483]|uniref:hypothetical protein n=1 Tax=Streptomyces sp. NBC_00483 TaxID=2975756 RepID=UPI002E16F774
MADHVATFRHDFPLGSAELAGLCFLSSGTAGGVDDRLVDVEAGEPEECLGMGL